MKFKYNVIGDNTAENRKHLELLSYAFEETNKRLTPYLYVNGNNVFFVSKTFALAISIDVKEEYINCIGNDSLFRAVSAIRDDSDYMQWFVCKISYRSDIKDIWHFCERPSMDEDSRFFGFISFRKATLSELINHFKQK